MLSTIQISPSTTKETTQGNEYQKIGASGSHLGGWLTYPYSSPPLTRSFVEILRFPNLLFLLLQFYQCTQKSTAAFKLATPLKELADRAEKNPGNRDKLLTAVLQDICAMKMAFQARNYRNSSRPPVLISI